MKIKKIINAIVIIIEIYLIVAYFLQKKYDYSVENIIVLAGLILFLYYDWKKLNIGNRILGLAGLAVIGHTFIGEYLNVYNVALPYDKVLHTFSSFVFTVLAYHVLIRIYTGIPAKNVLVLVIAASVGIASGVFVEIGEFLSDMIMLQNNQNGVIDTNLDLICDTVGSIIGGVFVMPGNSRRVA